MAQDTPREDIEEKESMPVMDIYDDKEQQPKEVMEVEDQQETKEGMEASQMLQELSHSSKHSPQLAPPQNLHTLDLLIEPQLQEVAKKVAPLL